MFVQVGPDDLLYIPVVFVDLNTVLDVFQLKIGHCCIQEPETDV